jgi:hypothetical protein
MCGHEDVAFHAAFAIGNGSRPGGFEPRIGSTSPSHLRAKPAARSATPRPHQP